MPGNLHFFDTTLPRAADANGKSAEEQLSSIYNYLYMLLEQFRYTLSNLEMSNFNEAALTKFQQFITDPINARIEDESGAIHELQITAGLLDSRITQEAIRADGAEQTLSSRITQTAEEVSSKVSRIDAEDIAFSAAEQTADSIRLSVSDDEGTTSFVLERGGTRIDSEVVDLHVKAINIEGMLNVIGDGGDDYASMSADGFSVYVDDEEKTRIYTNGSQVIWKLGIDNPGYVIKEYTRGSGHTLTLENESQSCWLQLNFTNDTAHVHAPGGFYVNGRLVAS